MSDYTNYFGIISEGQTDFPVLKNMLIYLFYEQNAAIEDYIHSIRPLAGESFGWQRVLNYCKSGELEQALQSNQYIIIQLDTDIAHEMGIDAHVLKADNQFPQNIIAAFQDKIIEALKSERYKHYHERILFAICVDSMECWLLPFYSNKTQIQSKTNNCLHTLQQEINKDKDLSYIKITDKRVRDYEKIARKCSDRRNKQIKTLFQHNPSLKIFVDNLKQIQLDPPSADEW